MWVFGPMTHVDTTDEGTGAAALGLDPASVLPAEAGLEDAFISLSRAEAAARGARGEIS